MKLVQIWKDGKAALGIQTEQGVIDVQAEGARRGVSAPADMREAIVAGDEGLTQLAALADGAQCFTDAPLALAMLQSLPDSEKYQSAINVLTEKSQKLKKRQQEAKAHLRNVRKGKK